MRHLLRLAAYGLVVLWLTWPLAYDAGSRLPNTHVACTFDTLFVAWALSHESKTLVTDPMQLAEAPIYHPTENALFYGDGGFGALPLYMPVFLLTGNPALAVNFTLLAGIALTAFALHAVVHRWTGSEAAGFVAAWTFLMNGWTLWHFVPSAPIYAVLVFFPFIIFLAAKPRLRVGEVVRLALMVVAQSLASLVYIGGAVIGPVLGLGIVKLLRPFSRKVGLQLLLVVALALLFLIPFAMHYWAVRAANPSLAQQTIWAAVIPVRLPWGLLGRMAPTAVPFGSLAIIVVGAASLLALGSAARPASLKSAWLHSAYWAAVGTLISITPVASVLNRWSITMPHGYLLQWLPAYQVGFFREPRRLGVAGLMGLALLSGLAVDECLRRLAERSPSRPRRSRLIAAVLVVALAGEMFWEYRVGSTDDPRWRMPKPASYPTQEAITPSPRLVAALQRAGGPLLELPLATKPFKLWPVPHARAMYRQIFHGVELVNGYSGYWPEGFQERMDVARRLPDAPALDRLVRETGVRTILVHTDELADDERRRWEEARQGRDPTLRLIEADRGDLLFAVEARPGEAHRVEPRE